MDVKRVLIVDDDEINRIMLYSLLENYEENSSLVRFKITEAINGLEAVVLAEDEGYDLILMDINMPGIDGIEATRRIRNYNPKSIILAVSGMMDEKIKNSIIQNGADGYLPKPVEPESLYELIRRYFGG